jgi:hypothetical protein
MPHGKRKGRQTNKSKKGHARHTNNPGNRNGSHASAEGSKNMGPAPTFGETLHGGMYGFNGVDEQGKQALRKNYKSIYTRYKEATGRFFQYMIDETPESIYGGVNCNRIKPSVNTLILAAEWMADQNYTIDPDILKCLKISIRMRSRVADSVFGGGDHGHKHLLDILRYCWSVLIALPRENREIRDELDDREPLDSNQFSVFEEEEVDEEDVDNVREDIFPSNPVPRPELESEPLSLEELLQSDDRNDAMLFVTTLNKYMGYVANTYGGLVEYKQKYGEKGLVGKLIECASSTNMIIQHVQQLEMDLIAHHEYMSTPHRVLSVIVMPPLAKHVADIMRDHASKNDCCTERDIFVFLGDCLEYQSDDKRNKKKEDTLFPEFCKKFEVDEDGTAAIIAEIQAIAIARRSQVPDARRSQVPDGNKMKFHDEVHGKAEKTGEQLQETHQWLSDLEFIGGDRDILNTIRLLQTFASVARDVSKDANCTPSRGMFGPPWCSGQSRKIVGGLNDILMTDMLPKWRMMCLHGILGHSKLPHENEICPLFALMRSFFLNPDESISWSFAFTVHALLTALVETDSVVNDVMTVSRKNFEYFFNIADWANRFQEKVPEFCEPEEDKWKKNVHFLSKLRSFGMPWFGDRATWNPLFGGTVLSYVCLFGNIEIGCASIDCNLQLRICLHLFHALKINGFLREGEIPFLELLHDFFKSSKAIWKGPLPDIGECGYRFWFSLGMNTKQARETSAIAKGSFHQMMRLNATNGSVSLRHRLMNHLNPADVSATFRRICNRDFRDVKDNYTPKERGQRNGTDDCRHHASAIGASIGVRKEQRLLSLHFLACGAVLEKTVCSLAKNLPFVEKYSASLDPRLNKRQGFALLFVRFLLGALDSEIGSPSWDEGEPSAEEAAQILIRCLREERVYTMWCSPMRYFEDP